MRGHRRAGLHQSGVRRLLRPLTVPKVKVSAIPRELLPGYQHHWSFSSSPHPPQSFYRICQQQTFSIVLHFSGARKPPTLRVLSKSKASTLPIATSNFITMPSEQAIITPNHELTETVATLGGRRHVICSTNDNKHDPPASESGEDDLEYDTEEEQGNEEAVARSVGLDTVINGDAEEPDRDNAADVENDDKVGMHGEAVTEIDSEDGKQVKDPGTI